VATIPESPGPASAGTPAVEFVDAGYELPGGRAIVQGIDLTVGPGEVLALVGRSGSGKTTTLKLVNRLLEPTRGTVRVAGRSTIEWDPVELRRRTGWVIQEIGLFPHLDVAANVGLVPRLAGWDAERIGERVERLLELVGLPPEGYAARLPHELSGGQRQRVGVARALAADPPLLLLDEPFGALDPLTRAELQVEFRELTQRLDKAALFVTHDLREALAVGDRIGLLDAGRLEVVADSGAFLDSGHPLVQELAHTIRPPEARRG